MKLWEKGFSVDAAVEKFTVGKDRELDLLLAPFDIIGTIAHVMMLESIGIITKEELPQILENLRELYKLSQTSDFAIEENIEDIHSYVEFMLIQKLGDMGKKVHSGRSRNDQVLVDMRLFTRNRLQTLVEKLDMLIDVLLLKSERHKGDLMPGYTHLQIAMPSSFGLWFGAYAEAFADDLLQIFAAWKINNQNPLGSAAGYGTSFPINRTLTTRLLGFDNMNYNVIYAQMGRGKTERIVSFSLANIAATLSKMAYDVCLFMSQNFNFVSLPNEFTTGSSIMPHKKNPDVFELIRGHCNRIQAIPQQITLISNNLPVGYFRDMQVLKEAYLPMFEELEACIDIATFAIENMRVNQDILNDEKYDHLFSVELVNKLTLEGMPFRDAYREVGRQIAEGEYKPERKIQHTHEGSIGNLCLDEIKIKKDKILNGFNFSAVKYAVSKLVNP
ncbi:MAG: argininosuccinate lyase [Prolixibacteraceae bacterium]|nr:argininosuccinate lyase [Prolixibacteraceae bacterium]